MIGGGGGGHDLYDDDNIIMDDSQTRRNEILLLSRRSMMATTALLSVLVTTPETTTMNAYAAAAGGTNKNNGLPLTTAPNSGLKWADAKLGGGGGGGTTNNNNKEGIVPKVGSTVAIDYSMASTVGRFPQIYTTKDKGQPYSWKIGDGTTIRGIELAIMGNQEDGIPPMKPGGIRRVVIPNALGYNQLISSTAATANLSPSDKNKRCIDGNEGSIGPIPPKDSDGAYQRWYQFYCNPRIPYQPDLVVDIKLYRVR